MPKAPKKPKTTRAKAAQASSPSPDPVHTPAAAPAAASGKGKGKAKGKKEEHIARPCNSWIIYRREKYLEYQRNNPSSNPTPMSKVSAIIALWWKAEPEHVRKEYEKRAEIEKEEHARKYPDYKYNPKTKEQKAAERAQKAAEKKAAREAEKAAKAAEAHSPQSGGIQLYPVEGPSSLARGAAEHGVGPSPSLEFVPISSSDEFSSSASPMSMLPSPIAPTFAPAINASSDSLSSASSTTQFPPPAYAHPGYDPIAPIPHRIPSLDFGLSAFSSPSDSPPSYGDSEAFAPSLGDPMPAAPSAVPAQEVPRPILASDINSSFPSTTQLAMPQAPEGAIPHGLPQGSPLSPNSAFQALLTLTGEDEGRLLGDGPPVELDMNSPRYPRPELLNPSDILANAANGRNHAWSPASSVPNAGVVDSAPSYATHAGLPESAAGFTANGDFNESAGSFAPDAGFAMSAASYAPSAGYGEPVPSYAPNGGFSAPVPGYAPHAGFPFPNFGLQGVFPQLVDCTPEQLTQFANGGPLFMPHPGVNANDFGVLNLGDSGMGFDPTSSILPAATIDQSAASSFGLDMTHAAPSPFNQYSEPIMAPVNGQDMMSMPMGSPADFAAMQEFQQGSSSAPTPAPAAPYVPPAGANMVGRRRVGQRFDRSMIPTGAFGSE